VAIIKRHLDGVRWWTVSGPRADVFRELGAAAADDIRQVLGSLPEAPELDAYAASPAGRDRVDGLVAATRRAHPRELQEACDLAAGAGVDVQALLLANLRGDLGGDDGLGCSDLVIRGRRALLAHNEDGAPSLLGRFMLLTLAIDDETPVTVQWYPGFVPSNTFVATGHGLMWGIDHIQTPSPAVAPGRHFVARAVQHCRTLDELTRFLDEHPSAGGFTFTIGERATRRTATVETAAGRTVTRLWAANDALVWHTNHVRFLATTAPAPSRRAAASRGQRQLGQHEESEARGAVLGSLQAPSSGVDVAWLLDVLGRNETPDGVCRSGAGSDPLLTLCTTVVDLDADEITLLPRGAEARTIAYDDYLGQRQ
jgi:hypothetical protein